MGHDTQVSIGPHDSRLRNLGAHVGVLGALTERASEMAEMREIEIAPGVRMPELGYGVWRIDPDEAASLVSKAIEAGFRSIDTATIYGNETGVGEGIRASHVGRDTLFVTTKLWNDDQERVRDAFEASMGRLGIDVLDLYLMHWPMPGKDRYVEAWREMVRLRDDGRVRAVGVSNFKPSHLQRIIDETGVIPAVNQIELHPWLQQLEVRDFHRQHGITTEAWSPIGQGKGVLEDPVIVKIAEMHGVGPAQVVLRWHLQNDVVAIPKTATPSRMRENLDVFGFELDRSEMGLIDGLDRGQRLGPDPDHYG